MDVLPCSGAPVIACRRTRTSRRTLHCCAAERSTQERDAFRRRRAADLRPPLRRSRVEAPPYDDSDDNELEYDDRWEDDRGWSSDSDTSGRGRGPPPPPPPPRGWLDAFDSRNGSLITALLAGAFALGIGAGVALDTSVTLDKDNVASSVLFDRSSPNSDACAAYGASAVVFDQRIYLSFNPFNVYVTQPEVKPGCVLRRSNWNVLESRQLVDDTDVQDCKRQMNTFAFVGDLEKEPEVSCVYHSERAENLFLTDPSRAVLGDGVRAKAGQLNELGAAPLTPPPS